MPPTNLHFLTFTVLLAALAAVQAADDAGQVSTASGSVYASTGGQPQRALAQGARIFSGDRITTAKDSHVELQFTDNARFVLGPNSEMNVGRYRYQGKDSADTMDTSIVRGAFRFISGLIAKRRPQSVKITMPVATIGIRGTHVVGEVTGNSATVALMEPEEPGKPTAIVVSNQYGSVVIDQPGFETNIPDAHSPPTPPRRVRTQRIDNLLRSIQSIRRVTVPRQAPRLPN